MIEHKVRLYKDGEFYTDATLELEGDNWDTRGAFAPNRMVESGNYTLEITASGATQRFAIENEGGGYKLTATF